MLWLAVKVKVIENAVVVRVTKSEAKELLLAVRKFAELSTEGHYLITAQDQLKSQNVSQRKEAAKAEEVKNENN